MATCLQTGSSSVSTCTSWGSTSVTSCTTWGTTTSTSCSSWGVFSFVCLAVTTIVTAVCLVSAVIVTAVCLAWAVTTTGICLVEDLVTTVAGFIFDLVEAVLGWLASLVAMFADLLFAIPIVGRVLNWLWNIVLVAIWLPFSLADAAAWAIGIRPQKKLRVCTVIELDSTGPVATPSDVVTLLNDTIGIYLARMNIQILNSTPLQFSSGFSAKGISANGTWVQTETVVDPASQLDLHCGISTPGGFAEDLGTTGSAIELKELSKCFFGNWRRLTGFGAPVMVLVVRSIDGGLVIGCGFGPLTDYVTIASFQAVNTTDANQDDVPDFPGLTPLSILSAASPFSFTPNNTLAHELGHICNLWHVTDTSNLMFPGGTQSSLTDLQIGIVRGSRHVSYL